MREYLKEYVPVGTYFCYKTV